MHRAVFSLRKNINKKLNITIIIDNSDLVNISDAWGHDFSTLKAWAGEITPSNLFSVIEYGTHPTKQTPLTEA